MLDTIMDNEVNNDLAYILMINSFSISLYISDTNWTDFLHNEKEFFTLIIKKSLDNIKIKYSKDRHDNLDFHFTNNAQIQDLNKTYRDMDKPTNVLSFPSFSAEEINNLDYNFGDQQFFGDIFIAYEYCYKESQEINFSLKEHIAHMIVHGILHIFGYDHIKENDAIIMESLEIKILKQCNINNPYQ